MFIFVVIFDDNDAIFKLKKKITIFFNFYKIFYYILYIIKKKIKLKLKQNYERKQIYRFIFFRKLKYIII